MKGKTKAFLIIFVAGLLCAIAGFQDTMLLIKGKTVDLTAPIEDFSEDALAEGTIDFVYGPFAVLEQTQKHYGITTSKTETNFYIVSNLEEGEAFVVLSTANKDMISKLNDAADEWYNYFTDESVAEEDKPVVSIDFKGKLASQPSEDDYDQYYQEAIDDLKNVGIEEYEHATAMRIVGNEVKPAMMGLCFGGAALALLGLVLLIVSLVKGKKKDAQPDFY
ncbi:MAG: hypothetical protein IJ170_05325 [Ruminococcus sp.]|nr:hypothetical protein [Ruminococcus sp.]